MKNILCIKDWSITSGAGTSEFKAGEWYDIDCKYPGLSGSTFNMGAYGMSNFMSYEAVIAIRENKV